MPLTTAGALGLGAGVNLLGSLLGFGTTSDVNQTNIQIAREQNEANRQLLADQQAFAVEQWNRENEYNLPKNVVKRLLDAGINPASLGSNAVIPAGSVGQPSSHPAVGANIVAPDVTGMASNFTNSLQSYFQNKNLEEQAKKTSAEAARYREMTPWEINQLKTMIRKGGIEGDLARTELTYQQAIQGQKISQAFGDTRLQEASLKMMDKDLLMKDLQNQLMNVQISYEPKMKEAELNQYYETVRQIKANIGLIVEQTHKTAEERLNEAVKRVGLIVDNGMKGLDYQIKDKTKQIAIDMLREDLWMKEDQRMLRPLDAYQKHLGKAAGYTITPGASQVVGAMLDNEIKRDRFGKGGYHNSFFRPRYEVPVYVPKRK